jgi:hypothetical protein
MTLHVSRPELSVELAPDVVEADLLSALRPRLTGVVPEGDVERLVHEAYAALGPVRVTTYLPILVERRVRQAARVSA